MSNPAFLVCDADSTIQILSANFREPLKILRTRYGIQPVVVDVVAVELRNHRRIPGIPAEFEKALSKRLITELTFDVFRDHFGGGAGPLAGPEAVMRLWRTIEERATKYELVIDRGEAKTFAAAIEMNMPAMSNDSRSLRTMRDLGLAIPRPVLLSFDVYTLGVQVDVLTTKDLQKICGRLRKLNEWVPSELQRVPIDRDNYPYTTRLVDGSLPILGSPQRDALRVMPLAPEPGAAPTGG